MSHISTVKSKVKFTDRDALKAALEHFGKVLDGTGSMTVVVEHKDQSYGGITSLSFLKYQAEWQARADQWGDQAKYEALVGKIAQQYTNTLTQAYIKQNHLSIASQGTDAQGNIKIRVRSY